MDNDRISWCVKSGGPCIGCAEHGWPDKFAGFHERLPDVKMAGYTGNSADMIGAAAGSGNCCRHIGPCHSYVNHLEEAGEKEGKK